MCSNLFAAGAVRLEIALAGLEQHALGHDGGAHRLVTGGGGGGVEEEEEEGEEGGKEEEGRAPHGAGTRGGVPAVGAT